MVKNKLIVGMFILNAIFLLTIVSADQTQLLCLTNGETVYFSQCNPAIPDYTCNSDVCQLCVKRLNSGVYCSRNPNVCNSLGLSCSSLNGNSSELDVTPPELNVTSPENDEIYNSRRILFNIQSSEPVTFYYRYYSEERWRKLSRGVSYNRPVNLREGENNITVRAVDNYGNIAETSRFFQIDSKTPKILKTFPKKGFADGNFFVQFKEENPQELILHYGNLETGMKEQEIDLNSCEIERSKTNCEIEVNLDDYNGEMIEYYFVLKDIADSIIESKHLMLNVDTLDPIIIDLNYTINGRAVQFNIEINEDNFYLTQYLDETDINPMWRRLCSRLRNGICSAKKTFRVGEHDVSIQIIDKAGNSVGEAIQFII